MKTTLEIPDTLFKKAKKFCAEQGIPFRALVESSLRDALERRHSKPKFRLKPFGFRGQEQLVQDWSEIRAITYAGRGESPENDGR